MTFYKIKIDLFLFQTKLYCADEQIVDEMTNLKLSEEKDESAVSDLTATNT